MATLVLAPRLNAGDVVSVVFPVGVAFPVGVVLLVSVAFPVGVALIPACEKREPENLRKGGTAADFAEGELLLATVLFERA